MKENPRYMEHTNAVFQIWFILDKHTFGSIFKKENLKNKTQDIHYASLHQEKKFTLIKRIKDGTVAYFAEIDNQTLSGDRRVLTISYSRREFELFKLKIWSKSFWSHLRKRKKSTGDTYYFSRKCYYFTTVQDDTLFFLRLDQYGGSLKGKYALKVSTVPGASHIFDFAQYFPLGNYQCTNKRGWDFIHFLKNNK